MTEAAPVACNGTGWVDGLEKTVPASVAKRGLSHRSGVSIGKRNDEMLSSYGNRNGRRCRSLGGNLIGRPRIRKPLRGRKNQHTGSHREKSIQLFVSLHCGRNSSFVFPSLLDCSAHLAGCLTVESLDDGNPQWRTPRIIQEHPGPSHCLQGSPMSSNNGEHRHECKRLTDRSEHAAFSGDCFEVCQTFFSEKSLLPWQKSTWTHVTCLAATSTWARWRAGANRRPQV